MSTYDKNGVRQAPYKEDSTKGGSIIQPLNYKGDMLTQAWVDSRILATLSQWMIANEYYPRSLSDVARRPLEILVEYLVEAGKATMVQTTHEAREHLTNRYRVNLNRGGRGRKNVLHNQILSDKREELGDRLTERQRPVDVQTPAVKEALPVDINKAMEVYNALQANETKVQSMAAIEAMKEAGMVAPSHECVIAKKDVCPHGIISGNTCSACTIPDVFQGMTLDEVNERQARIDADVRAKENKPLDMEELLKGVVK